MILEEIADGVDAEELLSKTPMHLDISPNLKAMTYFRARVIFYDRPGVCSNYNNEQTPIFKLETIVMQIYCTCATLDYLPPVTSHSHPLQDTFNLLLLIFSG